MGTVLDVADNSGAKRIACISLIGGSTGRFGTLGDVITASVKEAAPDGTVKKGDVVRAVIVRTAKEQRRRDGSYIRFETNSAVIIDETREPVGTRVFGPVARELRDRRFMSADNSVFQVERATSRSPVSSHSSVPRDFSCARRGWLS